MDWKARHPFAIGQMVWPRCGSPYFSNAPTVSRQVMMRGETERGLWIALDGIAYEFPADQFTAVRPMPPVTEAKEIEGAE